MYKYILDISLFIYYKKYYLATKKKEILSFVTIRVDLRAFC